MQQKLIRIQKHQPNSSFFYIVFFYIVKGLY